MLARKLKPITSTLQKETLMLKSRFIKAALLPVAATAAMLTLVGCSNNTAIPAQIGVRDVASGRNYTTYQPWGQVEKGMGYEFTDVQTGKRVTLTNYELHTIAEPKSVPNDSLEAKEFAAAKARGGVK